MKAVDWSLSLAFAANASPSGFNLSPEECRELSKLLSRSSKVERELDKANARIVYLMSPDSSHSPEGGEILQRLMQKYRITVEPTDPDFSSSNQAWLARRGDIPSHETVDGDCFYGATPLDAVNKCVAAQSKPQGAQK